MNVLNAIEQLKRNQGHPEQLQRSVDHLLSYLQDRVKDHYTFWGLNAVHAPGEYGIIVVSHGSLQLYSINKRLLEGVARMMAAQVNAKLKRLIQDKKQLTYVRIIKDYEIQLITPQSSILNFEGQLVIEPVCSGFVEDQGEREINSKIRRANQPIKRVRSYQ